MVLVDTSVWIDHFRKTVPELLRLANADEVSVHPAVIGELALGTLQHRAKVLNYMLNLAQAPVASDSEVLHMVAENGLAGKGIGWVDAHLLASARLGNLVLWTHDKKLAKIASELGVD